ncbi:hypothetical protein [Plantactinospora sp. KBS50]|uniref:hypothetical protein n=1 Tax=Plantactinospora sp. KBS50 TaxID=2024580 RepID=UPI001E5BA7F4|nr:hypothetical protein [Plantactinospora sp. KBS50]
MADQSVPSRRPDRRWDGPERPTPYGYRENGGDQRPPAPAYPGDDRQQRANPPYPTWQQPAGRGGYGPQDQAGYPGYPGESAYQPAGAAGYQGPQGSRWVGPEGIGGPGGGDPRMVGMLPDLGEEDDDRGVARRKALAAFGGTAAVVVGGAALAMSPLGKDLTGRLFGAAPDAEVAAPTDGTAARPSGQQPSTVRTYTEQNESYMGSRAGAALKKNAPSGGQVFGGPAEAAARTKVTVKTVLAKDPIRHLASRATFGPRPRC